MNNNVNTYSQKKHILIEIFILIVIVVVLIIYLVVGIIHNKDASLFTDYRKLALTYQERARSVVNEGRNIQFYEEDTLLLIPMGTDETKSCILVEQGGKSPYSDKFKMVYVGLTYDNNYGYYEYFFTAVDGKGYGFEMTRVSDLKKGINYVKSNLDDYAKILQKYYNSRESYIGEIYELKDKDLSNIADDINVNKIIILSADKCEYKY